MDESTERYIVTNESRKVYTAGGLLLVLADVAIQIWAIMLQTHPSVDIVDLVTDLVTIGYIVFIPGSILLVAGSLDRLFAIHSRINYAISLTGLAGMILMWLLYRPLRDLVYPRIIVVPILMIHSFWFLLFGPLVGYFHSRWSYQKRDASTRSE
ncbi:MAG: hypothetical protein ACOC38_02585 [Promethearchaeia archaeon]